MLTTILSYLYWKGMHACREAQFIWERHACRQAQFIWERHACRQAGTIYIGKAGMQAGTIYIVKAGACLQVQFIRKGMQAGSAINDDNNQLPRKVHTHTHAPTHTPPHTHPHTHPPTTTHPTPTHTHKHKNTQARILMPLLLVRYIYQICSFLELLNTQK